VYGGVEPVLLEHEQVLQDFVENYKSRWGENGGGNGGTRIEFLQKDSKCS
jgi:hypothetical protein